ncbi:hypothetical protein Rleg_0863 [Rhizobium leguminosarum bv. trifolii WSM1325]|jgi:hypothetical protein|uniref:Uncharacterized protein n=6 Tax=Rhizobium TaxID=379 RepID=C6ARY5_RHILS|nr:hypothetical protein Rleg_0863 [Rhizobium leguminosarum bv. trifolii WSM1325]
MHPTKRGELKRSTAFNATRPLIGKTMTDAPENEALFNITGHYVQELKAVLQSESIVEGTDYENSAFNEKRRNEGLHLLRFHKTGTAAQATQIWEKHMTARAHR